MLLRPRLRLEPPSIISTPFPSLLSYRLYSDASSSRPPSPIKHGSEKHHDMRTFLEYTERIGLDHNSTNYVGTHYEYTVLENLKRLGFAFVRTGRASDQGIDLQGAWHVPELSSPLRALVQCKVSKKLSPHYIRELEGAFTGMPAEWREGEYIGLLATTQHATKGVTEALTRSRWPMGFLNVKEDGVVMQFLWNASAAARGLEGLGTTIRYLPQSKEDVENDVVKSEIALTWRGKALPGIAPSPDLLEEYIKPLGVASAVEPVVGDSKVVEEEPMGEDSKKVVGEEPVKRKRGRPKRVKLED